MKFRKQHLMAKNKLPAKKLEDMEIDDMISHVETLMRWYSTKRSFYLANNIVCKLEHIRNRVHECENSGREMECERLIKQWSYLASCPKQTTMV